MTAKQSILLKPQFKNIRNFLEHGMIDLIEAMNAVQEHYRRGTFTYDETIEALKALVKVKTPA